jgi:hypothetical protein
MALRDRCRYPDFASAFGALRKSADDRQGPATRRTSAHRGARVRIDAFSSGKLTHSVIAVAVAKRSCGPVRQPSPNATPPWAPLRYFWNETRARSVHSEEHTHNAGQERLLSREKAGTLPFTAINSLGVAHVGVECGTHRLAEGLL